jgi:hypothetical protein
MSIKAITGPGPIDIYRAPAYGTQGTRFHLINHDTENRIYYNDTPTVNSSSNYLPPGGKTEFDGTHDVWCSTLDASVMVLAQMGIRGEIGWVSGSVDASPQVPNIESVAELDAAASGSPYSVYQFPSAGRVWGVNLSISVASTPSVSSEPRVYALAQIDGNGVPGNGTPLAVCESAAVPAYDIDSNNVYVPFNGLMVNKNQSLYLIVNGGTIVTGATITASAVFFYSVP